MKIKITRTPRPKAQNGVDMTQPFMVGDIYKNYQQDLAPADMRKPSALSDSPNFVQQSINNGVIAGYNPPTMAGGVGPAPKRGFNARQAYYTGTNALMDNMTNPHSLFNMSQMASGFVGQKQQQRAYNDYLRKSKMADNLYPITQEDQSGMRGDYWKDGTFRPNELGAKSPYGMFQAEYGGMMEGPIIPQGVLANQASVETLMPVQPRSSVKPVAPASYDYREPLRVPADYKRFERLSGDFQNYAQKAQSFIDRVAPGTDINGNLLADSAQRAYQKTGKLVPVELALAQLKLEGYLDKKTGNKPQRTRNPFNVGNTDDGSTVTHSSLQSGIDAYYNLMGKSYLKNKSADQLLQNFTNHKNQRYASDKLYEKKLNGILNQYFKQAGGDAQPTSMKIRITSTPDQAMAYGGQTRSGGLDLGQRKYDDSNFGDNDNYKDFGDHLNSTLQPVDPQDATYEAEKGEVIVGDFARDGSKTSKTFGGKRHSEGGTPANEEGFIFSDTKKMRLGGEDLTLFGKSAKSDKKFTPADIAKQYDLTKYKAILEDPKSDVLAKRTAQIMIDNYEKKLAQLALVQESKKGFPNGVPSIAQEYLQSMQGGQPAEETQARYGGQMATGGPTDRFDQDFYLKEARFRDINDAAKYYAPQGYTGGANIKNWQSYMADRAKSDPKFNNQFLSYLRSVPLTNKGVGLYGNIPSETASDEQLLNSFQDGKFKFRGFAYRDVPKAEIKTQGPSININMPLKQTITGESNEPKTLVPAAGPVPGDVTAGPSKQPPFGYLTPDKLRMSQALNQYMKIKKYFPYEAKAKISNPDPTFYDPTRALAANAEQANQQYNMNAMFAGPQAMGARNSQVAAQSVGNAANIASQYDERNVGEANRFSAMFAENASKQSFMDAQRATSLHDKNTIMNAAFDKEKMAASNNINNQAISAWDNRMKLGLLNGTNQYFNIDPNTGRFIQRAGKSLGNTGNSGEDSNSVAALIKLYQDYRSQGIEASQAMEFAKMAMNIGRVKAEDTSGTMQASANGFLNNFNFSNGNPYRPG